MIVIWNTKTFGKNISCLREERGMTLSETAHLLEISREMLESIESGILMDIPVKVMQSASRYFQIPLERLTEEELGQ